MQGLVMVVWGGWRPASWTAWPPSPCPAMDMASDMSMAFSSRRLRILNRFFVILDLINKYAKCKLGKSLLIFEKVLILEIGTPLIIPALLFGCWFGNGQLELI